MADLSINLAGIKSPNPFWIASGPPANTAYQAHRAFEAGWGGVVWKTIGDPIVNVSSRYSAIDFGNMRMVGLNNIELISDRSPETNFREIAEVKKRWPNHAVIASLMVDTRENWHDFVKRSADCGADGIELNFGCPHGMCERGMGSAVGQNPEVAETIVGWVMEAATIPVITKLTPNITDITAAARAAKAAEQRHLAHQHDQQHHAGQPRHLRARAVRRRPQLARRLLRAGGETNRAEHGAILRGRSRSAPPHFRHRRHHQLARRGRVHRARLDDRAGLHRHHALRLPHRGRHDRRPERLPRLQGHEERQRTDRQSRDTVQKWETLDLNYKRIAEINYDKCIGCNLCYIACEDGAHQAIALIDPASYGLGPGRVPGKPIPEIKEAECVGCNLCSFVCPVHGCITMVSVETGLKPLAWADYQTRLAAGDATAFAPHP